MCRVPTMLTSTGRFTIRHSECEIGRKLGEALALQWTHGFNPPSGTPKWTHGFHPYQASMSPALPRVLLPILQIPIGGSILDPFCGGGTVLIESVAMGFAATGVDLSPLAAFIASHQTWLADTCDKERLLNLAEVAVATSRTLDPPTAQGPLRARAWAPICRALNKMSYDTQCPVESKEERRSDLCRLWFCASAGMNRSKFRPPVENAFLDIVRLFSASCLRKTESRRSSAVVVLGDARKLSSSSASSMPLYDAVLSSPPYPGVYDYMSQARSTRTLLTKHTRGIAIPVPDEDIVHLHRHPWSHFLETAVPTGRNWPTSFDSNGEIGAFRSRKRNLLDYSSEWTAQEKEWVAAVGHRLKVGGLAAFVIGDGAGLNALESLRMSASYTGLFREIASATIMRPEKYPQCDMVESPSDAVPNGPTLGIPSPGNRRTEHLIMLQRT